MPGARDCLLVVDVQNDFLPGGALAVPRGDEIVPAIGPLARLFATVVLTQDWHPADHVSFAVHHPGRALFETIALPYGPQVLWPVHCVQESPGAALAEGLDVPHAAMIQRKGCHTAIDSYSAFLEADRATVTGLAGWLKARGVERVFICGLATDFCVAWTAGDARAAGFETVVVEDLCRAIDLDGSLAAAWAAMGAAGVIRATSAEILSGAFG
ncbi:bifunctional nicotinamidase/pyrazinamidase [Pinisolibacter aquiterrae]|uniref:bifunctional nicotinamidase/pyrazinamidase n=1 Tax=Pinisolibacter aquiterrae TaxID=2815579 RepID=UPI001C3DD584|nr:bifunctional nicotinamidase/pyrazinamidase [Pinisolibacter aquiterrae]MBV5264106.1 bifunctional nicotinamidase/pyrazinamidase [Pinisolibacter aquiterrae]MCC8233799.1 bifunctional nicotinamidase/pyrazinamidase [Pinisolibacter aquiterrae]